MNNQKQNRGRHRNNARRSNPARQNFDSNGPGVRIRGNATQVYEKYIQLARDAQGSGDRVLAENMLQHAEHYYRILNDGSNERRAQQQQGDATNEQQQAGNETVARDGDAVTATDTDGDPGQGGRRQRRNGGRGNGCGSHRRNGGDVQEAPASAEGEAVTESLDAQVEAVVETPAQPEITTTPE